MFDTFQLQKLFELMLNDQYQNMNQAMYQHHVRRNLIQFLMNQDDVVIQDYEMLKEQFLDHIHDLFDLMSKQKKTLEMTHRISRVRFKLNSRTSLSFNTC
jgi:hypothetical protein